MADNVTLPATGTGTANVATSTRTVTYSGDSVQMQVVGLATFAGSDDAKTVADIGPTNPLPTAPVHATIAVTPTLDTSVYASGDSLHTTVLSFANAVRISGGTGYVEKLVISDHDVQSAAGELWLFSATVTPAAANAAHSISDAHADLCLGVIPFGPYNASALNSISTAKGVNLPIACAATTLFGILVTRGTPTYTASGLVVSLVIAQN